ncbi:MAG: DUF4124 domain-containing protein [Burkholderiales bacterium]
MKRLFAFLAVALFAAAATAQQYKWIDQDGRVRYGDVPPPGVKATRLKPPSGPSAPPAAAAKKDGKAPLSPEAAFRKRQEDAAKDAEKQSQADAQAREKQENCARAQEYLRTLEAGGRISRTDAQGERYYLEDAQIAQETVRARQNAQQSCN